MPNKVYAIADHREGKFEDWTFELMGLAVKLAQDLGSSPSVVLLAHNADPLAQTLAKKNIQEVVYINDPKLRTYSPDAYAEALIQLFKAEPPQVILFPHTALGYDLAPKISAALNVGMFSECMSYRKEASKIIFTRQMYNGKILVDAVLTKIPYCLTVERGGFAKLDEPGQAHIRSVAVDLKSVQPRTQVKEYIAAQKTSIDISQAPIIVSGGRGVGKKENFQLIKDLAAALGGEFAASRPVVDNEWVPRDRQVGSSGKTVAPKLYIACGISGAIQHISGMKKSQTIVAINKDPEAPIFNYASYGIVGDLFEIIPLLIEEIKKTKQA